jgi:hypothetical protein
MQDAGDRQEFVRRAFSFALEKAAWHLHSGARGNVADAKTNLQHEQLPPVCLDAFAGRPQSQEKSPEVRIRILVYG